MRLPVDRLGVVDLDALEAELRRGALLVSCMHASHEVGTLQPLAEVAALCREHDALLHVDAAQTAGRLPVSLEALGADYVSVSAAKFGGGRGTGALLLSPRARLRPLLGGDERERRRRAGLEHLPGVAAMAETLLQLRPDDPEGPAAAAASHMDALRRRLRDGLAAAAEDVEVHGARRAGGPAHRRRCRRCTATARRWSQRWTRRGTRCTRGRRARRPRASRPTCWSPWAP